MHLVPHRCLGTEKNNQETRKPGKGAKEKPRSQVLLGNEIIQAVALPVHRERSEPHLNAKIMGQWHDAKCNFAGNCVIPCGALQSALRVREAATQQGSPNYNLGTRGRRKTMRQVRFSLCVLCGFARALFNLPAPGPACVSRRAACGSGGFRVSPVQGRRQRAAGRWCARVASSRCRPARRRF